MTQFIRLKRTNDAGELNLNAASIVSFVPGDDKTSVVLLQDGTKYNVEDSNRVIRKLLSGEVQTVGSDL